MKLLIAFKPAKQSEEELSQSFHNMSSEDLQFEDIVLLQLFKDQIMNYNLDQAKASSERSPSQQGDLSELDKILSEPKPCPGDWSEYHPIARLAQAAQGQ